MDVLCVPGFCAAIAPMTLRALVVVNGAGVKRFCGRRTCSSWIHQQTGKDSSAYYRDRNQQKPKFQSLLHSPIPPLTVCECSRPTFISQLETFVSRIAKHSRKP